jgi:hypothetical protein
VGVDVDRVGVRVRSVHVSPAPTRQNLPGIPEPSKRGVKPSQTDLAFAALHTLARPSLTQEVRERIMAAGYGLSQDQVRNALTWLLRSERVARVAPGTWAIPKEMDASNDVAPAAVTAGASQAGWNGPVIQGVAVPAGAGPNSHPAS